MIDWRIYYGDGSAFSSEEGRPEDAPRVNVMCIAWYNEDNRRRLAHAADYYFYEEGRWGACDSFGLFEYLIRSKFPVVLFGRLIGDSRFRDIMAKADHDLPLEPAGP
jgi:hypothetical protein